MGVVREAKPGAIRALTEGDIELANVQRYDKSALKKAKQWSEDDLDRMRIGSAALR
jgi:hypothetical protein